MNLTAKIFVVLILIMTLAFMFVHMTQFATRENWKRRWDLETRNATTLVEGLRKRLAEESVAKVQAEADRTVKANEAIALESELKTAKGQINSQATKINEHEDTIRTNQVMITALRAEIESKNNTIQAIAKRNNELNQISQVSRSVAHQLSTKMAEIEDDLNNQIDLNNKKDIRIAELDKRARTLDAQLGLVRKENPTLFARVTNERLTGTAVVDGVVAAVLANEKGQQHFVAISIGSKDGVSPGVELIVSSGGTYICRVVVEKVEGALALCQIVPNTWNTQSLPVRQGDRASNLGL